MRQFLSSSQSFLKVNLSLSVVTNVWEERDMKTPPFKVSIAFLFRCLGLPLHANLDSWAFSKKLHNQLENHMSPPRMGTATNPSHKTVFLLAFDSCPVQFCLPPLGHLAVPTDIFCLSQLRRESSTII